MRNKLPGMSLEIVAIILGNLIFVLFQTIPSRAPAYKSEIYKQAVTPDKSWSIALRREGNPTSAVNVYVEFYDATGRLQHRQYVTQTDTWNDIESRCPDLVCTDTEAKIGDSTTNSWTTYPKSEVLY